MAGWAARPPTLDPVRTPRSSLLLVPAALSASLPSPGTWTVEVIAVRQGVPLVFTFEVPIR